MTAGYISIEYKIEIAKVILVNILIKIVNVRIKISFHKIKI